MEENNSFTTQEEVNKLNNQQNNMQVHPLTCLKDGDAAHIKYEFEKKHKNQNYEDYLKLERAKGINYPEMAFIQTNLIATINGWICPVCDYTQRFNLGIKII